LLGDGSSFLDGTVRSGSTLVLVSSTSQEKECRGNPTTVPLASEPEAWSLMVACRSLPYGIQKAGKPKIFWNFI